MSRALPKYRKRRVALIGGTAAVVLSGEVITGSALAGQTTKTNDDSNATKSAAASTVNCPDITSQLSAVPAAARTEVNRNLGLLKTQIEEANNRLATATGQGGANFVQNAILSPLKDKRVATINRMVQAAGASAANLQVDALATCTVENIGPDNGQANGNNGDNCDKNAGGNADKNAQGNNGQAGNGQGRKGQGHQGQRNNGQAGMGQAGNGQAGKGEGGNGQAGKGEGSNGQAGNNQAGNGQGGMGQAGNGQGGMGQAGNGQGGKGADNAGRNCGNNNGGNGQAGNAGNNGGGKEAGAGAGAGTANTVNCPNIASRVSAVPAAARAEVNRDLGLLNTQIEEANNRLATATGQGGANFVQNAILSPLKDKRVATINRIVKAIGSTAGKQRVEA
ncbi:hypothetical protein ABT300_36765, partial [Streptomyces sp. NPDC001027]|uniref:hypothetical protein n=1 Tax=Streptomyces sp. NPDC001027 TaxID=3154771 RepID=UPI00331D8EDA